MEHSSDTRPFYANFHAEGRCGANITHRQFNAPRKIPRQPCCREKRFFLQTSLFTNGSEKCSIHYSLIHSQRFVQFRFSDMLAPRCFWRFLLTIVLVGSNLWSNVVCQDEYSDEVLKNMTSEELERICTVRGFEISLSEIDPTTGLPYEMTHEDFVEAAKQCLEIEREM